MCEAPKRDDASISYWSYLSYPSYSLARMPPPSKRRARAEGEVVLYSSLNNEQIVTLVDAFKKKYPAIKPSFYRGTSERVLQRASTEAKAGRFAVDVVTSAGFQVQLMKESGLTQRFVPPEAAAFDEGFKDPDGHWVNVHSLLNSMAYNTQLVQTQ